MAEAGGALAGAVQVTWVSRRTAARIPYRRSLRRALGSPWPDRNPLRRAVDRAESRLIAALIAAFLLGAPLVALAAFQARWHGAAVAARQEKAAWRQVPAVLLRGVPAPRGNVYGPHPADAHPRTLDSAGRDGPIRHGHGRLRDAGRRRGDHLGRPVR